MKPLILIASICILAACTATYQQIDISDKPTQKIPIDSKVLITTPADGKYATRNYVGSGEMTARAIDAAFGRYSNHVQVTSNCSSLAECMGEAQHTDYNYLVFSEILHWEDRATEWSGKSDRIEVKISLYEVRNEVLIHSTIIAGKSKVATLGGDHPQDLLPEPIKIYVSTLF